MATIKGNEVHEEDHEMIVKDIKKGKKREFARMMSQYCMVNHSPRRYLRSQNGVFNPKQWRSDEKVQETRNPPPPEKFMITYTRRSKAVKPKPVVPVTVTALDPKGIEDRDDDVVENQSSSNSNTELLDISRNVRLKKAPTNLKNLLNIDLLQGLHVRYVIGPKVKIRRPNEVDIDGKISGPGIICFCKKCNGDQVVKPIDFELHAGSRNKKPSTNIHLDNGKTLKSLLKLCKKVPLYSLEQQIKIAIGLADAQEGHMPPQSVEDSSGDSIILNGSTDESDDVCSTRNIEASNTKCFICRGIYFTTESNFGPLTTIYCDQCEKEYHIKCLKEHGIDDLKSVPVESWFCSTECRAVHSKLDEHLKAVEDQTLPPSMLNIIQKKRKITSSKGRSDPCFTWRLVNKRMASEDKKCENLLTAALKILEKQFVPIRIMDTDLSYKELIPVFAKGKTVAGKFYGGVYCAVLMKNSTVVCTALFRVFGQELAELPFVATAATYKSKGFCQALVGCIENLMASMHVKEVLLPASSQAEGFWKSKFGFEVLSDEQLEEYVQDYAVMQFEGTSMLHKSLLPKTELLGDVAN